VAVLARRGESKALPRLSSPEIELQLSILLSDQCGSTHETSTTNSSLADVTRIDGCVADSCGAVQIEDSSLDEVAAPEENDVSSDRIALGPSCFVGKQDNAHYI